MTKTEQQEEQQKIRIDFSLRREVFFVVIGAIIGAITFAIPETIFEVQMGLPYYLSWIVFGHILGVYSSTSAVIVLFSAVADFEYIDELDVINNTEITKIAVNNIKSKAGFKNESPLHSHIIYYSFSINIEKTNRIWKNT